MTLLRLAFGNWLSRAYLLVVVAVAVFVTLSYVTYDGPDANLAGVWIIFVTMPVSMLGTLAVDTPLGMPLFYGSIVVGALVNATVLGLLVEAGRRSRRSRRISGVR